MTDMIGGALKKSISGDSTSALVMFIGFFLVLFIKVYLVKISYNNVVPKIMKDDNVYKLTYLDALFVVILLMR